MSNHPSCDNVNEKALQLNLNVSRICFLNLKFNKKTNIHHLNVFIIFNVTSFPNSNRKKRHEKEKFKNKNTICTQLKKKLE